MLFNVPRLVTAYSSNMPDTAASRQSVSFGTSGHLVVPHSKTASTNGKFLPSQAIFDDRKRHYIGGPLFLGIGTHALFVPAFTSTLEVLVANDLEVVFEDKEF